MSSSPVLLPVRRLSDSKVVGQEQGFPTFPANSVGGNEEAAFGPDFVEHLSAKHRQE